MTDKQDALDAIRYCLATIKTSRIKPEENTIWSNGTALKPRITEKVLLICEQALTAAAVDVEELKVKVPEFKSELLTPCQLNAVRDARTINNFIDHLAARGLIGNAPQWQPIETAPKDGTVIVMAGKTRHAGYNHVDNGHWYRTGKKWVWHHYLGDEPKQPTHWMPLPQPPQERGDE